MTRAPRYPYHRPGYEPTGYALLIPRLRSSYKQTRRARRRNRGKNRRRVPLTITGIPQVPAASPVPLHARTTYICYPELRKVR